jgi:hypothetical protein
MQWLNNWTFTVKLRGSNSHAYNLDDLGSLFK